MVNNARKIRKRMSTLTPGLSGMLYAAYKGKGGKNKSSKVMSKSGADLDTHKVDRTVKKEPATPKMRGYRDKLATSIAKDKPTSILMAKAKLRKPVSKQKNKVEAGSAEHMSETFRRRLGGV